MKGSMVRSLADGAPWPTTSAGSLGMAPSETTETQTTLFQAQNPVIGFQLQQRSTFFCSMDRAADSAHRFVLLLTDSVCDSGVHRCPSALVTSGRYICGHFDLRAWCDQSVSRCYNVYLSLDEPLQVGKVDRSAFLLFEVLIPLPHLLRYVLHSMFCNIGNVISPVQLIQLTYL